MRSAHAEGYVGNSGLILFRFRERPTSRSFFVPRNPMPGVGFGEAHAWRMYERKTPFAIMVMRSGSCITKSNKTVSAEFPPRQLDEETLRDPMTMFGKDDDPFKGGKEEKGPAFTRGKPQTCANTRASMRLRGRCWYFRAFAHAEPPAFAGGHYSALVIDNLTPERYNVCNVSEGMCRQCETWDITTAKSA